MASYHGLVLGEMVGTDAIARAPVTLAMFSPLLRIMNFGTGLLPKNCLTSASAIVLQFRTQLCHFCAQFVNIGLQISAGTVGLQDIAVGGSF